MDARSGETGWTDAESRTYVLAAPSAPYPFYRLTITACNGATDFSGFGELELFAPVAHWPGPATNPSPVDGGAFVELSGALRWENDVYTASNFQPTVLYMFSGLLVSLFPGVLTITAG